MTADHRDVFEDVDVVKDYVDAAYLTKPEESILRLFSDEWKNFRMLDIGVGGGRTVSSFAPLVQEYHGVDFSESMIVACRDKFETSFSNACFHVCDARKLLIYPDNHFDFIMFSFNGIDTMTFADRSAVFDEVVRVSKPGCRFFFSTHNIHTVPCMFNIRLSWVIRMSISKIREVLLLRRMNPAWRGFSSASYAHILDGAHDFRVSVCYVRPDEQLKDLERHGFSGIKIYSLITGNVISISQATDSCDPWLYYLCLIRK